LWDSALEHLFLGLWDKSFQTKLWDKSFSYFWTWHECIRGKISLIDRISNTKSDNTYV